MAAETECDHLSHRDLKRPRKEQNTDLSDDDSTQMPNLLPEIIVEILSRLPVKSLLRFRCVCKNWRSLISDTHFIKKHLHASITDGGFNNHRLILSILEPQLSVKSYSIYSILNEAAVDALEFKGPYNVRRPFDRRRIIGSCNGMVCTRSGRDVFHLWNPSTRRWREMTGLIKPFRHVMRDYTVDGFGYDYFTDDYKVLNILCYWNEGSYATEVDVYSLKTNSWKRIEVFPYGTPRSEHAKCVSGALHWWASVNSVSYTNSSSKIVALDLANETYREVLEPLYQDNNCGKNMGVLGGNLSILCHYQGSHSDIWVMKEYGVRESWIKLFRIPYLHGDGVYCHYPCTPLCYTKNGEVLLEYRKRLVLYNLKDDSFTFPAIPNVDYCFQVQVCVESLVPGLELTGTP